MLWWGHSEFLTVNKYPGSEWDLPQLPDCQQLSYVANMDSYSNSESDSEESCTEMHVQPPSKKPKASAGFLDSVSISGC